ncbi:MAG: hypothetical protein AB7I33_07310 [Gemmatimonadales bacterium]
MDAHTYPDPSVEGFLNREFALTHVSFDDRAPAARQILRTYRLLWSPGFVVLAPGGEEIRRFIGFQQPRDFLAELRLSLGKVALLGRDSSTALRLFREAADLNPPAPVSPEALYWAGVAAYRIDQGDLEYLRNYWQELRERFPESRWWTHADVWDEGQ